MFCGCLIQDWGLFMVVPHWRRVKERGGKSQGRNPHMVNLWCKLKRRSLSFASQVNRFRHQHRISIQGTDLPDPIATFEQLQEEYKVHPKILENIQAAGFHAPTAIQMQAIPVMLHVSSLGLQGSYRTWGWGCLVPLSKLHQLHPN